MNDPTALNSIVTAVGWTLIHFIWQGTVFGVLFFGAMSLMREASANARYWAGMFCLMGMFAAAVATFCICLGTPAGTVTIDGPLAASSLATETSGQTEFWASVEQRAQSWMPWAVLAWLSGVLLISGRLLADYLHIRKLAVDGVRPLQPGVQAVVDRLLASLAIPFAPRVLETSRVAVPMVVGCLRPVILVPTSALMGLSPGQLELIISHELAHVKRLDYLFNLVQIVIETLLFYHPVVRAVSIRVRLERENCCDDVVVAQTGDSLGYARALTEVEGLRCSSGMQLTLAATGGHLMGRVNRLVAAPAEQRGAVDWAGGLLVVAVSVGVALSGANWVVEDPAGLGGPEAAPLTMTYGDSATGPSVPGAMADDPAEGAVIAAEVPGPAPAVQPVRSSVTGSTYRPAPVSTGAVEGPVAHTADEPPSDVAPPNDGIEPAAAPSDTVRQNGHAVAPPVAQGLAGNRNDAAAPPTSPPASASGVTPAPPTAPSSKASSEMPEPVAVPVPGKQSPAPTPSAPPTQPSPGVAGAVPPPVGASPEQGSERVSPERISGGRLVKAPQPAYPRRARISGIVGVVTVSFDVTETGRLEDVAVVDSTSRMFEGPVLKALKKWRYEPFLLDDEPVRARVSHTFQFELEAGQGRLTEEKGRCRKITGSHVCRPRPAYDDLGVVVVYNSALD